RRDRRREGGSLEAAVGLGVGGGPLMPVPADRRWANQGGASPSAGGRLAGALSRLAPQGGLLRSSAILFFGGSLARAVGFLFSVAAARLLQPGDYGLLAYGLAIVGFASILITSAPSGLAAFLARYQGNPRQQEIHFSNWIAVISVLIAVSAILMLPIAAIARLSGAMLLGIIANLLGLAVLQTYREAQRGLAPLALRFVRDTVELQHMIAVARFIQPLVLQTVFFAVWIGADLILVQRLMSSDAAGNYAAAKALGNAVYLAPSAVSGVVITRVSRMPEISLGAFLLPVMALGSAVTLPLLIVFLVLRRQLTALIFGNRYPHVSDPLALIAVGM